MDDDLKLDIIRNDGHPLAIRMREVGESDAGWVKMHGRPAVMTDEQLTEWWREEMKRPDSHLRRLVGKPEL